MPTILEMLDQAKHHLDAGDVAAIALITVGANGGVSTEYAAHPTQALKLLAALDISKDRLKADISGQAAS